MNYIPYSTRHNIKDPDLAGLLDYLEREMGWEIKTLYDKMDGVLNIGDDDGDIYICLNETTKGNYVKAGVFCHGHGRIFDFMDTDILFRTYRTLLPVIRDLYSK